MAQEYKFSFPAAERDAKRKRLAESKKSLKEGNSFPGANAYMDNIARAFVGMYEDALEYNDSEEETAEKVAKDICDALDDAYGDAFGHSSNYHRLMSIFNNTIKKYI